MPSNPSNNNSLHNRDTTSPCPQGTPAFEENASTGSCGNSKAPFQFRTESECNSPQHGHAVPVGRSSLCRSRLQPTLRLPTCPKRQITSLNSSTFNTDACFAARISADMPPIFIIPHFLPVECCCKAVEEEKTSRKEIDVHENEKGIDAGDTEIQVGIPDGSKDNNNTMKSNEDHPSPEMTEDWSEDDMDFTETELLEECEQTLGVTPRTSKSLDSKKRGQLVTGSRGYWSAERRPAEIMEYKNGRK